MRQESLTTTILSESSDITLVQEKDEFYILSGTEMPRRETIGSRLHRRRMELGLSLAQVRDKIYDDFKFQLGETTVRVYEQDKIPNPGLKTLEFLSLGLGLDPMEMVRLALEDSPEGESGYKESQFARLWQNYKKLNRDQRAFIDESVEMLIAKIEKWR